MNEKLKEIAAKLGATFMPGPHKNHYMVFGDPTNPETLKLLVYSHLDGKYRVVYLNSADSFFDAEGKIKHTNTCSHYRQSVDSINVSLDRTVDTLAKDISRRMLQPALAVHDANIKEHAKAKAREVERQDKLKALGLPPGMSSGQVWRGPDMARAEVTESSYEYVTIKLRWIRHSLALKLIKFLEENGQ
jgi:hypothetical protein